MIKKLSAMLVLNVVLLSYGAVTPVQNMSAYSLAAEYYSHIAGHADLYDLDSSAIWGHYFRLHYAPIPYLRFTGGIGGSSVYASPSIRGTRAGFSATGGVGLYTPRFFDMLTITAGYDGYHLKAQEKHEQYLMDITETPGSGEGDPVVRDTTFYVAALREGKTTAALHVPYFAAIFHIGRHVDLEIGGRFHYYSVTRNRAIYEYDADGGDITSDDMLVEIKDALSEQIRVYAALTIHEYNSGAYITGGASFAVTDRVEDRGALPNMSIWGQIGLVMRDEPRASRTKIQDRRRHEEYMRLKARQDRMMEILLYGVDGVDDVEVEDGSK